MSIFSGIAHFFVGIALVITSMFHPISQKPKTITKTIVISPTITPQIPKATPSTNIQSISQKNIKIAYKGTYTHLGQTSEVTLNIPSLGGEITGSVSEACNGPVEGRSAGSKISGSANGSCKIAGLNVGSTATYDGDVDTKLKKATINFKGTAGVFTLNDSMQLYSF